VKRLLRDLRLEDWGEVDGQFQYELKQKLEELIKVLTDMSALELRTTRDATREVQGLQRRFDEVVDWFLREVRPRTFLARRDIGDRVRVEWLAGQAD